MDPQSRKKECVKKKYGYEKKENRKQMFGWLRTEEKKWDHPRGME